MRVHVVRVAACSAVVLLSACSPQPRPLASRGTALVVSWEPPETAAALELTVSAPDLPRPVAYRLGARAGPWTIHVPPGPERTIAGRAVDALGFTSHAGALTLDVSREQRRGVDLPLRARFGGGAVRVHVTPDDAASVAARR